MTPKNTYVIAALALLCLFLLVQTIQVWQAPAGPSETALRAQAAGRADGAPESPTAIPKRSIAPKSAFQEIALRNLFSPERTEYKATETEAAAASETADEPVEEPLKVDGKQIVLYGVVLLKDRQAALISNPDDKTGDAPTRWVGPNDKVGQYTVKEIAETTIILAGDARQYRVPLFDKNKSDKRRRGVSAAAPKTAGSAAKPTVVTTQQPAAAKQAPAATPAEKPAAEDGYQVIRTPFGDIKRKEP